uniref:Thymidylate kinase n=1 Tax=Philasterides dicentrarchi TaxID=282688 RepID=A0A5J6DV14_9CILI|nr:thymidylate kinase [Philasterides dicentrarchi]
MQGMDLFCKRRGLLIVFEGLDRCGKSTQCKELVKKLQMGSSESYESEVINFPERTTLLGRMIDGYLKGTNNLNDQTIHLLFSANRWEKVQEIKQKLNEGKFIILDRYAYSGVAFSSAKGLDLQWCKSSDVGLPKPDLTFFLSADEGVTSNRADFGEEVYEKKEFQEKVKQKFEILKKSEGFIEINANQSIELISEQIYDIVRMNIAKQDTQLDELWKCEQQQQQLC